MAELLNGTDPSMLHALRAAGLSPRMNLKCNAGYATALCPLRNSPLPWQREELIDILDSAVRSDGSGKPAWGVMRSHIDTLYSIDEFWFERGGKQIAENVGNTLDEQRAWRCKVNSLIKGMGFKCLSWALFIYSPDTCQLLTLDSWHAKRLQVDGTLLARDNAASHALYEKLESLTIAEVSTLYPGTLSTVGAACLWYNIRNSGPESHAGLNCRVVEYAQVGD
jgi:hypothetical protein